MAPNQTNPRLVIVTGVAGSGRATAMRVLEDLGFYCVDNLPVALAPDVLEMALRATPMLKGIALGIDARERLFFPDWPRCSPSSNIIIIAPKSCSLTPLTRC